MVPPTLARGKPESSPRSKAAEGDESSLSQGRTRVAGDVDPSGDATGYPELSLKRPTKNLLFGPYLWRGDIETAIRYNDFLGGIDEIKALPLKDRRRRLKNEVFRVSIMFSISLARTFLPFDHALSSE